MPNPIQRKVKGFSVFVRISRKVNTVTAEGNTLSSYIYPTGTLYTYLSNSVPSGPLEGDASSFYRLVLESDSVDECKEQVNALMEQGHALPMIRVIGRIRPREELMFD